MTLKKMVLAILVAGISNAYADDYTVPNGELTGDETVCFSHDYPSDHKSGTDDKSCRRYYYRGQGACPSHAWGNAKKMCKIKSDNPSSCDLDKAMDCYPLTAVPSDAVLVEAEK